MQMKYTKFPNVKLNYIINIIFNHEKKPSRLKFVVMNIMMIQGTEVMMLARNILEVCTELFSAVL